LGGELWIGWFAFGRHNLEFDRIVALGERMKVPPGSARVQKLKHEKTENKRQLIHLVMSLVTGNSVVFIG